MLHLNCFILVTENGCRDRTNCAEFETRWIFFFFFFLIFHIFRWSYGIVLYEIETLGESPLSRNGPTYSPSKAQEWLQDGKTRQLLCGNVSANILLNDVDLWKKDLLICLPHEVVKFIYNIYSLMYSFICLFCYYSFVFKLVIHLSILLTLLGTR